MAEQQQQPAAQPAIGRQSPAVPTSPAAPKIDGAPVSMSQLPPSSPGSTTTGHYKDGKLTRAGMEHVVRSGGSFIHHGENGPEVINNLSAIPSEAELAKGDVDAEAAALENINRQRAALDAQEATLRASSANAGKAAPAPKK